MGWAGLGIDSTVDIHSTFKKYKDGFIQGNFDEKLMMAPKLYLQKEITEWLDSMERIDRAGWICGLGHGIHKETPEENVKLFVDMVRERFE
jgi:uroporphyrinogen decarboxylase